MRLSMHTRMLLNSSLTVYLTWTPSMLTCALSIGHIKREGDERCKVM